MGRYAQASRRGRPRERGPAPVSGLQVEAADNFNVTWTPGSGGWMVEWELEFGEGALTGSAAGSFTLASGGGETSVPAGTNNQARARARAIVVARPHAWSEWATWSL